MELILFTVLAFLSSSILISGAIRKDEQLMIASGTIFMILGASLTISGVQIQSGSTTVEEDTGTNTTEISTDYNYTSLDESTGLSYSSNGLSIILLVLGLYLSVYSVILGDGKPGLFRNFLSR